MSRVQSWFLKFFVDGVDAKGLWRRYVVGLLLIVILLLGSHTASILAIASAEDDARVINQSGRQRMLSQRLLYFASKSHHETNPALGENLRAAVDLFETSHNALSRSPDLSTEMRKLYFELKDGASLDMMLRRFVADARLILSANRSEQDAARALARMEAVGPGPLLKRLDEAVKQYEAEANARSAKLLALQDFSILLAIVTILVEALAIFVPAQLAVSRTLSRLEAKTTALDVAKRSEEQKNRELEEMRSTAEHEALHDPLTGLANRRYLERMMRSRMETMGAAETGIAVLHIDLDRFKQINDTLGHAAGDYVLQHVAGVLKDITRERDFVARVGGDEFVVVTPSNGDRRPLEAMAARIIERLCRPIDYDGDPCRFGASVGIDIGIATAADTEIDPELLLTNADIALYRAKGLGRGRFVFFCDALRAEVETGKALADELLLALSRREFMPVYQPQICARTGALFGVEALARWRHPERGVLAPGAFLPIAERLGVAPEIDEQILTAALRDLAQWDARGLGVERLSVNVSALRLRDQRLAQHLSSLEIPRDRISFEILETVFTDVLDDELRFNLDLLDELGVAVEIDDFGTGHASLASMISLAPHRLKIARELVAPLPDCPRHRALAASILDIARALEIGVIAEGVETADQAALLSDLGCDVLQGYWFAKPMPAEALIARISSGADWRAPQSVALSA